MGMAEAVFHGGRGGIGRSGGRGRGQFGDQRPNKSSLQCHYCQKFGH